jgi:predicted DNA-binding ribbon-helix-helix protein
MDKRSPRRSEVDVGRRMEREFYKQLSEIVQKWEQAFANLEEEQ